MFYNRQSSLWYRLWCLASGCVVHLVCYQIQVSFLFEKSLVNSFVTSFLRLVKTYSFCCVTSIIIGKRKIIVYFWDHHCLDLGLVFREFLKSTREFKFFLCKERRTFYFRLFYNHNWPDYFRRVKHTYFFWTVHLIYDRRWDWRRNLSSRLWSLR